MADEFDSKSNRVTVENLPKSRSGSLKVELVPMPSGDNPWRTRAEYIREQKRDTRRFWVTIGSLVIAVLGVVGTAVTAIQEIKRANAISSPLVADPQAAQVTVVNEPQPVSAAGPPDPDLVKEPFLFSEDEETPQTDLLAVVPHSSVLADTAFFDTKVTYLDYILIKLEERLSTESEIASVRHLVVEAFEPLDHPYIELSIEPYARYSQATGRIFVGYAVDNLGRPRRPLRGVCDALLSGMSNVVPQEPLGWLYHNIVLGVLNRGGSNAQYTPAMTALASSIVHRVSLQTKTVDEDGGAVHHLSCQRAAVGASPQYAKFSFKSGG